MSQLCQVEEQPGAGWCKQGQLARLNEFIASDAEFWQAGIMAAAARAASPAPSLPGPSEGAR